MQGKVAKKERDMSMLRKRREKLEREREREYVWLVLNALKLSIDNLICFKNRAQPGFAFFEEKNASHKQVEVKRNAIFI